MLSSNTDPGIICFQHCITKVFCFNLPAECPTCKYKLIEKDLILLPFRLPYPLIKATQYPCSIVLRPTNGDFLNDYNNSMDLHIAVTTSRGVIVEFDQNGLQKTKINSIENRNRKNTENVDGFNKYSTNWTQSLLVESVTEPWYDFWDSILDEICQQTKWTVDQYNEDTQNCYTFVLEFLQALNHPKLTEAAKNKMKFCELYIVPKTIAAGKYISLYRRIRNDGLYIHLINKTKICNRNEVNDDVSKTNPNNIESIRNNSDDYNDSITLRTQIDESTLYQLEKSINNLNLSISNSKSTKLCTIEE